MKNIKKKRKVSKKCVLSNPHSIKIHRGKMIFYEDYTEPTKITRIVELDRLIKTTILS